MAHIYLFRPTGVRLGAPNAGEARRYKHTHTHSHTKYKRVKVVPACAKVVIDLYRFATQITGDLLHAASLHARPARTEPEAVCVCVCLCGNGCRWNVQKYVKMRGLMYWFGYNMDVIFMLRASLSIIFCDRRA